MKKLEEWCDELFIEMQQQIDAAGEGASSPQQLAERNVQIVQGHLNDLKRRVLSATFDSSEEEILFFKRIKPRFHSQLIYYYKVLQILLRWPPAGRESVTLFLHYQLDKLSHFFNKHLSLYEYYRSGATYLDALFFTRGRTEVLTELDAFGADIDPQFSTGYDFVIAKMKGYELVRQYLESELQKLQQPVLGPSSPELTGTVTWTASKAALIELLYALQSTGVMNNGKAALNDVAVFLEAVFNIKLGNYYRVFQEIRIRKKSRTQFLDEMKERLLQRMDYTDENPHIA